MICKQLLITAALLSLVLLSASADTGYALYGDPPDETHPWAVHDRNRPQPTIITGVKDNAPPSDAIVLFDGTDLSKWEADKPNDKGKEWIVSDGCMECVPGSGYIKTKEEWGDCQLHLEWTAPTEIKGDSQGRGNSGVFLMGKTEVQVLDNFDNPSYPDGMAGSLYGVNPPMVNPLNKPGEFNSYDIIFRRPLFVDGVEVDPGYMTVFINGVLVQDHTPLEGGGGHKGRSKSKEFPATGPLKIQDHGNPVRFRNIWYRPLPPRALEGGTNGAISPEAATAKRAEIAASVREKAAGAEGDAKLEFLMESLAYEQDADTLKSVQEMAMSWVDGVKDLQGEELEAKKGLIMGMNSKLTYMTKHKLIPAPSAAADTLAALVDAAGWNDKKK